MSERPPLTVTPYSGSAGQVIFFSKTNDPFGEFSNFYPKAPFWFQGKEWRTSEHCYQAMKFTDEATQERIRGCHNAMAAAIMGRDPANTIRENWDQLKEPVMALVVEAKFSQNKPLTDLLISTGDLYLAELSYKDQFWGTKPDLQGYNRLGFQLMHLRDRLAVLHGYPLPGL